MTDVNSFAITPEALALIPRMLELLEEASEVISEAMYTHIFYSNDFEDEEMEEEIEESQYALLTSAIDELLKKFKKSNKVKRQTKSQE